MSGILGVVAMIEAKSDHAEAFVSALADVARLTRAEQGCLMYEVHREIDAPARFVIFERWSDEAALAAHMKSAGFAEFMKQMGDKLASRPTITKLAPVGN